MKKLTGLIPPMVTPLDAKRRLDKKGTRNMVHHLLKGGVDGIFLLGTTGEGPHLSYDGRGPAPLVCHPRGAGENGLCGGSQIW